MEWETLGYIAFISAMFLVSIVILVLANLQKIKNQIKEFREAYLTHFYIYLCFAVVGTTLIFVSVGLFVNNAIGYSILWAVIGGFLCYKGIRKILFLFPPAAPKEPQNNAQEALLDQRDIMQEKLKSSILRGSICCLVVSLVFFGISYNKIAKMNQRALEVLSQPVDRTGYVWLVRFNEDYKNASIIEKAFFDHKSDIRTRQEQLQAYVEEYAKDIEQQIDALEPCTVIYSENHCEEIWANISQVDLIESDTFDAAVLPYVSNFSKLTEYKESIVRLQESYKVTCSTCYGSGTVACSYCGGSGVLPVKWYSEGDWGAVSYSNYDCNTCGGSGKKSCHCNGRSIYIYEDQR